MCRTSSNHSRNAANIPTGILATPPTSFCYPRGKKGQVFTSLDDFAVVKCPFRPWEMSRLHRPGEASLAFAMAVAATTAPELRSRLPLFSHPFSPFPTGPALLADPQLLRSSCTGRAQALLLSSCVKRHLKSEVRCLHLIRALNRTWHDRSPFLYRAIQ